MRYVRRRIKKYGELLSKRFFGGGRPELFVVGAQKAGTTSLFCYLNRLPGFKGSLKKEVGYFYDDDLYAKGVDWYESHFLKFPLEKESVFFEATPEYLYKEKVAARIHEYNSKAKIVMILREPVSRAYSAWNMYREWSEKGVIPAQLMKDPNGGNENPIFSIFFKNGAPTFSDYVKYELGLIDRGTLEDEPGLIRRGLYVEQVRRYVQLFGWENVLVIGASELKQSREEVISRVVSLVKGEGAFSLDESSVEEEKNKREYPSGISREDKGILENFYDPYNRDLFSYLGREVNW